MKIAIMSKGRADTIGEHSLKLFPNAYLVVDKKDAKDYEHLVPKERLVLHPGVYPPAQIAQWILDKFKGDDVVIADDDIVCIYGMPGWAQRRYDSGDVCEAVLENACSNAKEAGAYIFGFASNPSPLVWEPYKPIHLARWMSAPFGFVKGHGLRVDDRLTVMADVDISLQSLMKHRIVWCDRRWAWFSPALQNEGGNANIRSAELYEKERAILKEKWGQYIRFDNAAVTSSKRHKQGLPSTTHMTYVHVPRTQHGF